MLSLELLPNLILICKSLIIRNAEIDVDASVSLSQANNLLQQTVIEGSSKGHRLFFLGHARFNARGTLRVRTAVTRQIIDTSDVNSNTLEVANEFQSSSEVFGKTNNHRAPFPCKEYALCKSDSLLRHIISGLLRNIAEFDNKGILKLC